MTTMLDRVLQGFSQMDLELLYDLLEEECTYSDFPKGVFLQQLGVVFEEFKLRDPNLQLQIYRGGCCSRICAHRLGNDGFRFFGLEGDHLDLRFILQNEENGDVSIHDIYACSRLISNEVGPKIGKALLLWFYEDDKYDIALSPNLLVSRTLAVNAEENWHQNLQTKTVTLSEIKNWVMIHESIYLEITAFEGAFVGRWKWDEFLKVYDDLKIFLSFCDEFTPEIEVFRAHQKVPIQESNLLNWILNLENRLEDRGYHQINGSIFKFQLQETCWKVEIKAYRTLFICEPLIGDFFDFMNWFESERKRLVRLYFAFTAEELDEFLETDPAPDICYRMKYLLSYHLEIRNRYRKNGIFLPFGLG